MRSTTTNSIMRLVKAYGPWIILVLAVAFLPMFFARAEAQEATTPEPTNSEESEEVAGVSGDHQSGFVECTLELIEGNFDDGRAFVGDQLTAELKIFGGLPHQWEYVIDINDGWQLYNNEGLGTAMTFSWEVSADHVGENHVYPLFYTEDVEPLDVINYDACSLQFSVHESRPAPPPVPTPSVSESAAPAPQPTPTSAPEPQPELAATGMTDSQVMVLIALFCIAVGVAVVRCKPRKQWPRRLE